MDLLVVAGLGGALYGVLVLGGRWASPMRPAVEIDLSAAALPGYALYSMSRGLIAYVLSLAFTLVYGLWAARDRQAERVLLPLLDVLQSIPVLGFMPGVVLALVALFPGSNVGLELAAIVMIFTGQVWNLTFGFYQSLKSVPPDLREAAAVYRFSPRRTFRRVEVPLATTGLVWNSMMSMAGGWFFLMVSEAFVLGDRDFRLPGLGSYMSVATAEGDVPAMLRAVLAMVAMIVVLDQLLWRPLVAWAQKFRVEESGAQVRATSWALDLLRRSRLAGWWRRRSARRRPARRRRGRPDRPEAGAARGTPGRLGGRVALAVLVVALLSGGWRVAWIVKDVSLSSWLDIGAAAGWTLLRVLAATFVGTLWTVPAGLAIGLSPRLSAFLQPVVQVVASFPAPMVFPLVVVGLAATGIPLEVGSVALMLLGTQWYILFNVIAGATAIPSDLREAARSYRFGRAKTFRSVHLPAVFPYLVTGWVAAAGGAWNASIVSEYVAFRGGTLTATGLGARISEAAEAADFAALAAGVTMMSAVVVLFNRVVWRRCYRVAERRFSLAR